MSDKVGVSPEQRQSTKSNTSTKILKVLENFMEWELPEDREFSM